MIQILKSGSHPIPPQGSDVGYDLVAISEPVIFPDEKKTPPFRKGMNFRTIR